VNHDGENGKWRTSSIFTFAEFMRAALYDEDGGYYMRSAGQFGRGGDFYTANQVHEFFGEALSEDFAAADRTLRHPPIFTIVELGPGRGEFAGDALTAIQARHQNLFARLHYICCEISPALRDEQKRRLGEFGAKISWIDHIDELAEPVRGVFFANEFFDALPCHLVRQRDGALREMYVARDESGRYEWIEDRLSEQKLEAYWRRVGVSLDEGQRAEINLAAVEWLEKIARKLERGWLLTVDYGDLAPRLYSPDKIEGTLRCFHRHRLSDDPLVRVGEQDLTANVNFTALIEYGRDFGLETIAFTRLTDYLIGLGLLERAVELAQTEGDDPPSLQHRLALKQLFLPQGLAGSFRVLKQERS
jgi:SAM-dependent MidA family methyltransferase